MFKRVLIIFFIFLAVGSCYAQSSLVIYDADGDRIGTLVSVPDPDTENIHMATDDGYLIKVDTGTGVVRIYLSDGAMPSIWYQSTDCSGQPYMDNDPSGWLYPRGGEIFQMGTYGVSHLLAKVEWGPNVASDGLDYKSSTIAGSGVCSQENVRGYSIPITFINPADYKIKLNRFGQYIIKPPITVQVERPDVMFCNSFESCPATE